MKNKINLRALMLVLVFLLAAGGGLLFLTGRPVTVDFDGQPYTLASHSTTFGEKKFAFAAKDGASVSGRSTASGGMVVTYAPAVGEASSVVTGKVIRKDGKFQKQGFLPDEEQTAGTAISEPEAHRFVLAVARREAVQDYSLRAWLYYAMAAVAMIYGAFILGKERKKGAKWLPKIMIFGAPLVIVAVYADLLFM